jgi:hypothetical protein
MKKSLATTLNRMVIALLAFSRFRTFKMKHITQAVCNDCDVLLTRDVKSIITPHREWLEKRFPKLKVRLPSELLAERISSAARASEVIEAANEGECQGSTAGTAS